MKKYLSRGIAVFTAGSCSLFASSADAFETIPASTFKLTGIVNPSPFSSLMDMVDKISLYLFNIAIPIAVVMIVYSGVRFLMARDNPGEVSTAKQILVWALIGLAIITIGRGFVTLVKTFVGA